MQRADLVVFISKFARKFIEHRLGCFQGRSVVVPHGVHPSFRAVSGVSKPRPIWLPKEDYFLYVSFVDYYKAQLELVRGFSLYRQQGGEGTLVLVGAENRPYGDLVREEVVALGLSDWVSMIGNVPHTELPAAYQHARINLFASFTENCPNILLEMMASGRPSLVSNREPMTEFGGNAVAYFDPGNPSEFAHQLASLVADEERQQSLASAAMEQTKDYTWQRAARLTWSALAVTYQSHRSD